MRIWSPSGDLLFARGTELFRADHDGRNARKVLSANGIVGGMRFSPDGSRIRYTVSYPQ